MTQRLLLLLLLTSALGQGRGLARAETGGETVVWSVTPGRGHCRGLASHRGQSVAGDHPLHGLGAVPGHVARVRVGPGVARHVSVPGHAGVIVAAHPGLRAESSAVCLLPVRRVSIHLDRPVHGGRGPATLDIHQNSVINQQRFDIDFF